MEPSSAPAAMVPSEPAPACATTARPEFSDSVQLLPSPFERPDSLAKRAIPICARVRVTPFEKLATMWPCASIEVRVMVPAA